MSCWYKLLFPCTFFTLRQWMQHELFLNKSGQIINYISTETDFCNFAFVHCNERNPRRGSFICKLILQSKRTRHFTYQKEVLSSINVIQTKIESDSINLVTPPLHVFYYYGFQSRLSYARFYILHWWKGFWHNVNDHQYSFYRFEIIFSICSQPILFCSSHMVSKTSAAKRAISFTNLRQLLVQTRGPLHETKLFWECIIVVISIYFIVLLKILWCHLNFSSLYFERRLHIHKPAWAGRDPSLLPEALYNPAIILASNQTLLAHRRLCAETARIKSLGESGEPEIAIHSYLLL